MKDNIFLRRSLVFSLSLFFIYARAFASPTVIVQDSNYVKKLLDSAYVLENTDKKAALNVYRKAFDTGKQTGYILGQAKALHYSGIVYSDMSRYKEAVEMYRKALVLYQKINYPKGIGACYTNIGNVYQFQSKLDSALSYYQQSLTVFAKFSQTGALSQASGNVGVIFQQMQQFDKAFEYYSKAVKYAEIVKDSSILCHALINLGAVLNDLGKVEESFQVHKRVLNIATEIESYYALQITNINIADYYKNKKQYDKAIVYGQKSLYFAIKASTPLEIADIQRRLGDLYILTGNYTTAKVFLEEALQKSRQLDSKDLSCSIYDSLNKLYAATGNYKEAYRYLLLSKNLNDSILGENQIKTINELEVKYQTAQKDQQLVQKQLQIAKQDLRIKQKTRILMITISSIVLLLIIASFVFVNYRNKMKLQNQHLILLEKEKEISNLEATIKGEEKERSRIAKNLHDGVGGLLSAAKMHFSIFKTEDRLLTQPEFFKALDLLDDSATEIRKIAHNLMPELLINHGLIDALSHFIKRINTSQLKIDLISIGELPKCNENLELTVYRIIQELINNIIKHAEATEVLVQLSYQDDLLAITVEDNGKGFDPATVGSNGAGLSNMENRVKTFGGTFELNSSKGNGTTVFIEFELTTELKYV